jgi:acyl transferase domain-containing protein
MQLKIFWSQQALRDGDKIWATLNTGTNQDGRTVSPMTAPSGQQQKVLMHSMYDKYQLDISRLDYIEAHGEHFSLPESFLVITSVLPWFGQVPIHDKSHLCHANQAW